MNGNPNDDYGCLYFKNYEMTWNLYQQRVNLFCFHTRVTPCQMVLLFSKIKNSLVTEISFCYQVIT